MTQGSLDLDDPRAEPVPPDPHEISTSIDVSMSLRVDVALLAFKYREEIQSEATTEMLRRDGYTEKERFDVWLHYFLLDRAGMDVWAPRADGVRETWTEPEVNFRLDDKAKAAVAGALDPSYAIPTG